jgi:hypothetical protein
MGLGTRSWEWVGLVSPGPLIARYCYFFQLRGLPRLTTLTVLSAFGRRGLILALTRGAHEEGG